MDWMPIIVAVIGIIFLIVITIAGAYLRERMSAEQQESLLRWLRVFCSAAETAFDTGAVKKEWVLEQLAKIGVPFTESQVDACLEAVVRQLKAEGVIN